MSGWPTPRTAPNAAPLDPGDSGSPLRHDPADPRAAAGAARPEATTSGGTVAGERPRPSDAVGPPEAPRLGFTGTTPYEDYVRASVLTRLQRPLSDDPGEMSFLVTTQVMELWFTVIVYEWRTAVAALADADLARAMAALRRSQYEWQSLNASWQPLAHLTPARFNAYRAALGAGSGFQSAMYRRMEFLLGEKSAAMLVPHRGAPAELAELERALGEPSLYDAVLRFLAGRGHDVPRAVLDRAPTERHEPDPGVERVWQRIYAGPESSDEIALGEALTEIAELVGRWRNDHLVATRRAMGAKVGTGGSAGVAWLEKRATRMVFPELWSARSHV